MTAAARPVAMPMGACQRPSTSFAEKVPHHQQDDDEVHLPEADRYQDRVQQERWQAQRERNAPDGSTRKVQAHDMQREDEQPDESRDVHHRPHVCTGSTVAEGTLPGREEQRSERGIREQEARVGQHDGVEVRGEDVAAAQPQVHTQIHLVCPKRDVEPVAERRHERDEGGAPGGQTPQRRPQVVRTAVVGIEGSGHLWAKVDARWSNIGVLVSLPRLLLRRLRVATAAARVHRTATIRSHRGTVATRRVSSTAPSVAEPWSSVPSVAHRRLPTTRCRSTSTPDCRRPE